MKKVILISLPAAALIYTLWYMHFGSLTDNSGALSTTGLSHPVAFTIWGVLTFAALYSNILYAYGELPRKHKFQYFLCGISAIGMALTLTCDFDYAKRTEFYIHCAGALTFSVLTGVCVFVLFLLNYKKSWLFAVFTYIIGAILIVDLILLIIFNENALIETVPVIFALITLPIVNFTDLFKEKAYASR